MMDEETWDKLFRIPIYWDPVDELRPILGDDISIIVAMQLEKQIGLEKKATKIKESLLNYHIEQGKISTEIKEQALKLVKEKL